MGHVLPSRILLGLTLVGTACPLFAVDEFSNELGLLLTQRDTQVFGSQVDLVAWYRYALGSLSTDLVPRNLEVLLLRRSHVDVGAGLTLRSYESIAGTVEGYGVSAMANGHFAFSGLPLTVDARVRQGLADFGDNQDVNNLDFGGGVGLYLGPYRHLNVSYGSESWAYDLPIGTIEFDATRLGIHYQEARPVMTDWLAWSVELGTNQYDNDGATADWIDVGGTVDYYYDFQGSIGGSLRFWSSEYAEFDGVWFGPRFTVAPSESNRIELFFELFMPYESSVDNGSSANILWVKTF